MPHYVTKLWEKFLLPCTIYLLERQTSGIQKLLERWEVDAKPKWFQTKGFLIGITLFAAVSIAFPYYAPIFYPDNKKEVVIVKQSNIQTLNFDVKGMTCASCEEHVKHAVNELEGIVNINASYEKANAEVEFDNTKTTKEDIEKAINSTGYKVINKEKDE